MAKYRQAAKVDANQSDIVDDLRSIPSITVELGHDDILVGYQGRTYWYEIKNGKPTPSKIKPDQYRLLESFTGHYKIVWTTEMILEDIGLINIGN